MPNPIELDWSVVVGDGWSAQFPAFDPTGQPVSLLGYGADFSLRANFGDASPLVAMAVGSPSPNGSTIAILPYAGTPGTGTVCVVTPTVTALDTSALVASINPGAKTTRFWYQARIIPPSADPITIVVGSWYLRSRA